MKNGMKLTVVGLLAACIMTAPVSGSEHLRKRLIDSEDLISFEDATHHRGKDQVMKQIDSASRERSSTSSDEDDIILAKDQAAPLLKKKKKFNVASVNQNALAGAS
eukprot:CAMPEP_0119550128 /NCGR_PEP_ID=MMETSP1352-20130426/3711_1 /TAXON_ID=265584 /ORGANISM="Stauroneis constricta, Strain CCMP1120" /LENGTH=105 /DNA_ID=CAMNT_0007595885 /DNA_START=105 /DNA_END=422 /DNA_ORIENTATION=+